MRELPHTHSCFVCGESNPAGLKLRFTTDGTVVRSTWTPGPERAGFQNVVHGGVIATVLDEVMVWVCVVRARRFAYCGELSVRYQRPLRPGTPTELLGELVADRRGRLFEAMALIKDPAGVTLAEANGKYLPIQPADLTGMLADVVGDLAPWIDLPSPAAAPAGGRPRPQPG